MMYVLDEQLRRSNAQKHIVYCESTRVVLSIDHEIAENYVSSRLVHQLGLPIVPHPKPHYLEDHDIVARQCTFWFLEGFFEDRIQCNEIHLLHSDIIL